MVQVQFLAQEILYIMGGAEKKKKRKEKKKKIIIQMKEKIHGGSHPWLKCIHFSPFPMEKDFTIDIRKEISA